MKLARQGKGYIPTLTPVSALPPDGVEAKPMMPDDHALVHELSQRLEAVCRYAQCIASAEGDAGVQQTWRDLERQELANIRNLRLLVADRMEKGEFFEDFE
jgi:hypothetical protein